MNNLILTRNHMKHTHIDNIILLYVHSKISTKACLIYFVSVGVSKRHFRAQHASGWLLLCLATKLKKIILKQNKNNRILLLHEAQRQSCKIAQHSLTVLTWPALAPVPGVLASAITYWVWGSAIIWISDARGETQVRRVTPRHWRPSIGSTCV